MSRDESIAVQLVPGECELCGCTDEHACIGPDGACQWIAPGLCSYCALAVPDVIPGGNSARGHVVLASMGELDRLLAAGMMQ